jgi:hypothetical protein
MEIARTTVANILAEAGLEPAPERNKNRTWKQFFRSHWETLYSCDFFAVETLGIWGTVRYMVFFVMELRSRAVHVAGIRLDPDGAWMMQVARSLLDPIDGFLRNATHLIHDRDPLYTKAWTALLESGGVECVRLPAHRPMGYLERDQHILAIEWMPRIPHAAPHGFVGSLNATCTRRNGFTKAWAGNSSGNRLAAPTTTGRRARSPAARVSAGCSTSTIGRRRDGRR